MTNDLFTVYKMAKIILDSFSEYELSFNEKAYQEAEERNKKERKEAEEKTQSKNARYILRNVSPVNCFAYFGKELESCFWSNCKINNLPYELFLFLNMDMNYLFKDKYFKWAEDVLNGKYQ